MDGSTDGGGIGLAVRRARHAKGFTQAQLAGRAGKTNAWLSKIERGLLPLEKRSDIAALAEALEVSADTLLGEPAPEVQPGRRPWNLQPLRSVLLDASPDDPPDIPARPVAVLRDLNGRLHDAVHWARYDELPMLPSLIGELEVRAAAGEGPEQQEALRLLVTATATASAALSNFGHRDLAWVAAERGRQAAGLLGDPVWEAAAAVGQAFARSSTNKSRVLLAMPGLADATERLAGTGRHAMEVYGMLRLLAALSLAVQGNHAGAAEQGTEAARVAGPLGDRPDAWEVFGPSNVGVWRASLAVEAGNAEQALAVAAEVEPRALASGKRRAALRIEKARALAMLEKGTDAVAELRHAERLSPMLVHNNPLVRELVRYMLDRARREAGGRELRGLAWRMGVI